MEPPADRTSLSLAILVVTIAADLMLIPLPGIRMVEGGDMHVVRRTLRF
ncbi:MAG TPA: hypothetical protein VJB57_12090 [Dehalococcoidia bacterium]|nr:hypothetical protein [Dehalococcoidia bacterium]